MIRAWLLIAGVAIAACALTGLVRAYTLKSAILDVPNYRSSHVVPTPRGGGLAIAITVFAGVLIAAIRGIVPPPVATAIIGGGALVAAVGWLDDCRGVPAPARFAVHLAAVGWAVWLAGGLPVLRLGVTTITLGPLGAVFATVLLIWLVNLYNFMDGIDGIAGSEAVLVGATGGALALASGGRGIAIVALIVAASAAGFLVWNWPPAKIFMGDVGSGLLGYLFGVVALFSERSGGVPLVLWCLLLGVFLVDSTITLLRRVARGERWYAAHHSHAYQRLVQAGYTHRRSTCLALVATGLLCVLVFLAYWRAALLPAAAVLALVLLGMGYLVVERIHPMGRAAVHNGGDTAKEASAS